MAIVQATMDSIPGDKILVGHSYGGFVITNAAIGRTDVLGLVYTAAYVSDTDETITSLSVGYTPGAFLDTPGVGPGAPLGHRRPAVLPRGLRPGLESEAGRRDSSPAAPDEPGPSSSLPSGPGAWHALPSWYAVSGEDRAIDPNLQRFMAQRAGSTTVQFNDASHVGGLFALQDTLRETDRTSRWHGSAT